MPVWRPLAKMNSASSLSCWLLVFSLTSGLGRRSGSRVGVRGKDQGDKKARIMMACSPIHPVRILDEEIGGKVLYRIMLSHLRSKGATVKVGPPPKNPLERSLQKLLTRLQADLDDDE